MLWKQLYTQYYASKIERENLVGKDKKAFVIKYPRLKTIQFHSNL